MATSGDWLAAGTKRLKAAGLESARLDCLILLEDALEQDRAWLLAHPEYELPDTKIRGLDTQLAQREHHMPLAYIRGRVEFYGQTFVVSDQVLVPRPESEAIINLLRTLPVFDGAANQLIIDIGTGSGALAITAERELSHDRQEAVVLATDIDPGCLAIARRNARQLGASVDFIEADLLKVTSAKPQLNGYGWIQAFGRTTDTAAALLDGALDQALSAPLAPIILANLPYVPTGYPINRAASHEPKLALFAGQDGLDAYRTLWQQLGDMAALPAPQAVKPRYVITEALLEQHQNQRRLAAAAGYKLLQTDGLAQCFLDGSTAAA